MSEKLLFVDWCPKDAIDGMQMLDPWEELAYRRILDFIYITGDRLEDNKRLGWMTKTGNRWPRIRERLIELGKIYIDAGFIRNEKCQEIIQKTELKIVQKSVAGKASASKRKSLKTQDTRSTAVDAPLDLCSAKNPTELQLPKNPRTHTSSVPNGTGAIAPEDEDIWAKVFREGKRVLVKTTGCTEKTAGACIQKIKIASHDSVDEVRRFCLYVRDNAVPEPLAFANGWVKNLEGKRQSGRTPNPRDRPLSVGSIEDAMNYQEDRR